MSVEAKDLLNLFSRMPKEKRERLSFNLTVFLAIAMVMNIFGTIDVRRVTDVLRQWPEVIETQEKNSRYIKEIKEILARHGLAIDEKKQETATAQYE